MKNRPKPLRQGRPWNECVVATRQHEDTNFFRYTTGALLLLIPFDIYFYPQRWGWGKVELRWRRIMLSSSHELRWRRITRSRLPWSARSLYSVSQTAAIKSVNVLPWDSLSKGKRNLCLSTGEKPKFEPILLRIWTALSLILRAWFCTFVMEQSFPFTVIV